MSTSVQMWLDLENDSKVDYQSGSIFSTFGKIARKLAHYLAIFGLYEQHPLNKNIQQC